MPDQQSMGGISVASESSTEFPKSLKAQMLAYVVLFGVLLLYNSFKSIAAIVAPNQYAGSAVIGVIGLLINAVPIGVLFGLSCLPLKMVKTNPRLATNVHAAIVAFYTAGSFLLLLSLNPWVLIGFVLGIASLIHIFLAKKQIKNEITTPAISEGTVDSTQPIADLPKSLLVLARIHIVLIVVSLIGLAALTIVASRDPNLGEGIFAVAAILGLVGGPLVFSLLGDVIMLLTWKKRPGMALALFQIEFLLSAIFLGLATYPAGITPTNVLAHPSSLIFAIPIVVVGVFFVVSLIYSYLAAKKHGFNKTNRWGTIGIVCIALCALIVFALLPRRSERLTQATLSPVGTYTGGGTIDGDITTVSSGFSSTSTLQISASHDLSIRLPELPKTHFYELWLATNTTNTAEYLSVDAIDTPESIFGDLGKILSTTFGDADPKKYQYVVISAEPLKGMDIRKQTQPTQIILTGHLEKKNTLPTATSYITPSISHDGTMPILASQLTPVTEILFEKNPASGCTKDTRAENVTLIRSDVPFDWHRDSPTGDLVVADQAPGYYRYSANEFEGQKFYLTVPGTSTVLASDTLSCTTNN